MEINRFLRVCMWECGLSDHQQGNYMLLKINRRILPRKVQLVSDFILPKHMQTSVRTSFYSQTTQVSQAYVDVKSSTQRLINHD